MGIGDGEPVHSRGDSGRRCPGFSHSASTVKFVHSLFTPHEGNPKRDALMAEIWAMVTKGAVISLPQDPGPGFYCNLFLVMKVTGGTGQ